MLTHLSIQKAHFLLSAPNVSHLPQSELAEVAFWGRSNVGKSSLLNFLTSRQHLAKVSRTPGRTRALNVFEAVLLSKSDTGEKCEKPFRLIDLPGFGYAKMSHDEKYRLSDVLEEYASRPVKLFFHLMDSRRELLPEDIEISQALRRCSAVYVAVLTKADQIPVSKRIPLIKRLSSELAINRENCILTSTN